MPIIGNPLNSVAFLTDSFNGNGSTTAFTMSVAPATSSSILVVITGVTQAPSVYSVVGTTLTFSTAPPSGTANISVRYLGIPASGVTTTAYRTLTEFTATASQTTFTPPSYTVGFIAVYQNGVMLGSTDYTATNGTTVVLAVGALVGDLVTTESFYVSSVLNALPVTGGTISGNLVVTGTETVGTIISPAALTLQTNNGTTAITVDTSQNVGIGTSSPLNKFTVLADGSVNTAGDTIAVGSSIIGSNRNFSTASNPALFNINSNSTLGADVGGTLGFGGRYTSTSQAMFAIIKGAKENATDGNYSTYLAFGTRSNGSDITERMRIDSSGNLKFNSGYGSVATAYGCRAWVNFNGTGTVAIRASGNVSSITDNGTGDYTVNFTTAMPDANYSTSMLTVNRSSGSATNQSSGLYSTTDTTAHTYTASAVRISTNKLGSTTGFNDADTILLSVFR